MDPFTLKVNEVQIQAAKLCPTLCDPMNYTVHGILQARILEPYTSPGDLPNPGTKPRSPALQAASLPLSHKGSPLKIKFGIVIVTLRK